MACLLEGRHELAQVVAACQAARMIPVQVRRDHRVHLVGLDAEPPQRVEQVLRFAQGDLPRPLLAQLGADPGLADDDPAVDARDQANARAVDHVVGVGRLLLLPENPRYDTEHQAAVGLPLVGHQKMKLEVAQLHGA